MIEKFLLQRARQGDSVDELTLEDLLADEDMEKLFATTFAVVTPGATIPEVKAAMAEKQACQDVFVTQDGTVEGAVMGWFTNTML